VPGQVRQGREPNRVDVLHVRSLRTGVAQGVSHPGERSGRAGATSLRPDQAFNETAASPRPRRDPTATGRGQAAWS
jgi:hypothetical protein